ncbi:MAG: MFS transporter [candidate division KSB1 bacterium]|nr:MFS transporter [candidate division KSB1 bacterium]MDZ7295516.1 MFS transporter [candidate division KSB1 bacterium]
MIRHLFGFFATQADKPPIPDRAVVDRLYRRYRLLVMIAITVGYGLAYTCRLGLSVVKKPLIDSGAFSPAELGTIGSAFFYTYAFGKLVNGFLADHANLKRFGSLGVLGSALINGAIAWCRGLGPWVMLWGLNGWFQGFAAPTGVVSLSRWFSNRERGRFYGIWSTAHAFGEGITWVGSAALVSWLGWQWGFWGPAAICVGVAIGLYFTLQDRPQTLGLPPVAVWRQDFAEPQPGQPLGRWQAQLLVLKTPAIWLVGLASAGMYITRYAINSWGFLYLQEAKGYSFLTAGSLLAINTLAGVAGCVAFGFISDHLFHARRPPANLLFGLLELAALGLLFLAPPGKPALIVAALAVYGFGLNGLVTSLGGLFAVDIAPKQAAGAALGFVGVFSYIAAAVQERVSGHLIQKAMVVSEGVRTYHFTPAILFWLASSTLSLLLAATLWRAHTQD